MYNKLHISSNATETFIALIRVGDRSAAFLRITVIAIDSYSDKNYQRIFKIVGKRKWLVMRTLLNLVLHS